MGKFKRDKVYEPFMEEHEIVKEWLEKRPKNTQRNYGCALKNFCEFSHINPEEFQSLPNKEAKNLVWEYVRTFLPDRTSAATISMAAMKSFYRNKDGEQLGFDTRKGGKHYFNNRRRKRVVYEHKLKTKEVYEIADMCSSIRDRVIVLVLFQSGIRVNALTRLTYGMVRKQIQENKVPIKLRITDKIDTKLQGYSIAFYDTFIGKEAIEALKKYCEMKHRNSEDNALLFQSRNGTTMNPSLVWFNLKKATRRAGLDAHGIWVHSLRKAFRNVVRHANLDDDFKEAIMGHVLPNSRENYFMRNDAEEIEAEYVKLDFSREGKFKGEEQLIKEALKQKLQLQTLREQVEKTEGVGEYIDVLYKQMENMQKQINALTGKKTKLDVPTFVQKE